MVRVWRSVRFVAALAAVAALAGGCDSSPTAPTHYSPYSQLDLRIGGGAEAVAGLLVSVHYTGWFYDASKTEQKGVQFETSAGNTPLVFTLGAGQVIAGWDQGIVGMKVGGLRRIIIPPSLGYGSNRYGEIPPNATLLFEVDLLAAGTAPTVTTQPTSISIAAGTMATFTAAAGGDPAPTVQWQVSTDGGLTWANVPGATETTLSFSASAADSGKDFRAVFTNAVASTVTATATLTVTGGS